MKKRNGYKASLAGKIVAVILIVAFAWMAWEFGLLEAIADVSTVSLSLDRSS